MVLVLCLGLLPYMTVPASAAESQIIVGGVTLTGSGESPAYATTNTAGTVTTADASESNYNIKWDGSTLILNGATIIGSFSDPAISCAGSLTITLVESNTVTSERTSCIHTDGNLTINGSGQLSAAIDSIKSGFDNAEYYGIYVGGSLTITSGTVTVTGGHLTGYGQLKSYGIYASNDMTVSGGAVTATGGSVNLSAPSAYSYGIYVNGTTNVTGGTVTAIGGTATSQYTYAYTYGLYVGALNLSGGTITAMSGTATAAVASSGHGAVISSGFTISGGTFTAIGTKSGYQTNMFIHYNPPQGCTFYQIIGGNNGRTYTQMTISSSSEGNLPQDRPFTRIITVRNDIDPVITEITVTPSSSTIQAGDELQFSADVTGINGADEAINWSVSGNQHQGTTISPAGLLTVDVNETAPNLTVTATSAQDGITFASVAVSVTAAAHIHEGVLVPSVAATCTEPGSKAYYVCSCNKYFEDAECSKEITELDTWKVIPASGHQWSDTYLAEHADAEKHYHVCEICGEKDEGQAHTYGDDQTCDVCGYLRECIITFDANEGSVDTTSAKTENGKLPNLPTPTREGHDFTGWYTAKDGGELVTTDTVFYADTTLYAHWRVKTPPVITVNISPAEGGSCLVAEITSDMDEEDLAQLKPEPLENGTYTAKEFGSTIVLLPQTAPGYMMDTADYVKIPGEDQDTVSFDGPPDFSYITIVTKRDLTVNLTFREVSNLTVGDATLSNGPVCYATTDDSGHVTPQPDYTENDSWNIKWDRANSTLTLRGATIQGIVNGTGSSCGIFYEGNLSIVLEGTNQVTGADVDTANGEAMSTGIYGKGKLSFSGSGSLTAAAGESASSVGIAAEGALTFGDRVNVNASGADVSVTGDVDVSSIKWGGQSAGVFSSASITVQDEADVTATGGHYQVSESGKTNIGFSTGCQSIQVSVQGGKLTAAAQESTNDWFGIEAYTVTASGGEIIASGNPVFYWENSEEEGLGCIFTVVPPAGKLYRVEAGNGGSPTEIAGSPFTAETALDSSLFQSDTAFHCYLADDPTHQHTYDQWKYDETNHWHACACGANADDAAPHAYDNDADTTCNVCGYVRQVTPPVGTEFTVNFNANGGDVTPSSTVTTGGKLASLPTPTRSDYAFMGWYTEAAGGQLVAVNTVFTSDTTLYAQWKQVQFSVSVKVVENDQSTPVIGATVVLMQGSDRIGTGTTNDRGEFTFTQHIPAGAYNIVTTYKPADGEAQTKTSLVVITDQDVAVDVALPSPGVNSTLTVTESTPAVVVGGLDAEAEEQKASDVDVTEVTVSMAVEKKPEAQAEGSSQIQQAAAAGTTLEYLEIAITKTVVTSESTEDSTISETETVLEIVVPFAFTDKKNIMVYRYHDGMAEALTEADTKADGTFQLDAVNGLIRIFASKFSTYAIGYTMDEEPVTPPITGGSSHDDTPTFSVTLPSRVTGGTVTAAKRYAQDGETFRFTVTADAGYELESLTVTDSADREIKLTREGGGVYSFEMPARPVEIEVSFREIGSALPFTDVDESHWAVREISWAVANGYMNGTSTAAFTPGGTVSRQQVWMILARIAGENPADMAEAKIWAVASGISDGSNPGAPVTRQQLAALLYRYAVQYGFDVSVGEDTNILSYTDVGQLSEYAVPAMQWACGAGIINGTGDGSTLSPQGTATRAQLAVMLYRWLA